MVWVNLLQKIIRFILVNGKMTINKEMESKLMKKGTDIRDSLKMI